MGTEFIDQDLTDARFRNVAKMCPIDPQGFREARDLIEGLWASATDPHDQPTGTERNE